MNEDTPPVEQAAAMLSKVSRRLGCGLVGAWLLMTWSSHAGAQTSNADDARALFRQGLVLVDAGRFEEAVVAFERAYAVKPRASVLYNVGMAQVAARRLAAATRTFERYVQAAEREPGLPRLAEVRRLLVKLGAQVGRLELQVSPANAQLRIDGQPVAAGAIVLDPGSHVISASAAGHAESERTLVVGVGEATSVELALARAPELAAPGASFVTLQCQLAAVEIAIDGHVIARTPAANPISLRAGAHELVFRRPGYLTRKASLVAVDGALARVDCGLLPEATLRSADSGLVTVRLPLDEVEMKLDGRPFNGNGRVPRGNHWLSISRAGFAPWSSRLEVEPGQQLAVTPQMQPTPASLREAERARSRRVMLTASTAGASLLLAGVTTGLLIDNSARHEAWQGEQVQLDELWRAADGPESEPSARQSHNDTVARRITLQDQLAVGTAVASGAFLVASAIIWFATDAAHRPAFRVSEVSPRAGSELSFTW